MYNPAVYVTVTDLSTTNLAKYYSCSSVSCMQPVPSPCLTSNGSYDCSGFIGDLSSSSILNSGYLNGIEFYNGQYYRGATHLCLDTSGYNSLLSNNSVLSLKANTNYQSSRISPAPVASSPLTTLHFQAYDATSGQICYADRNGPSSACPTTSGWCPACAISGTCCDSCLSNAAIGSCGVIIGTSQTSQATDLITAAQVLKALTETNTALEAKTAFNDAAQKFNSAVLSSYGDGAQAVISDLNSATSIVYNSDSSMSSIVQAFGTLASDLSSINSALLTSSITLLNSITVSSSLSDAKAAIETVKSNFNSYLSGFNSALLETTISDLNTVSQDFGDITTSQLSSAVSSTLLADIVVYANDLIAYANALPETSTSNSGSSGELNPYDISFQINDYTEQLRTKLPWEAPALSGSVSQSTSLCVSVPSVQCLGVTPTTNYDGTYYDGFATWTANTNSGQTINGSCNSGTYEYGTSSANQPTRTCYAIADTGEWGEVTTPCHLACSAVTDSGDGTYGYATFPKSYANCFPCDLYTTPTSYTAVTGTCNTGYGGSPTMTCEVTPSITYSTSYTTDVGGVTAAVYTRTNSNVQSVANWTNLAGSCTQVYCPENTTGGSSNGFATWAQSAIGDASGVCQDGYVNYNTGTSASPTTAPSRTCSQTSDSTTSIGSWGSVSNSCVKGCKAYDDTTNHVNFPDTLAGSSATGTCDYFASGGSTTQYSSSGSSITNTCSSDGTWGTQTSGACGSCYASNLPTTYASSISFSNIPASTQIANGVSYNGSCVSPYYLQSGTTSPTATCINGSWSITNTSSCITDACLNSSATATTGVSWPSSGFTLNGSSLTGSCNSNGYYLPTDFSSPTIICNNQSFGSVSNNNCALGCAQATLNDGNTYPATAVNNSATLSCASSFAGDAGSITATCSGSPASWQTPVSTCGQNCQNSYLSSQFPGVSNLAKSDGTIYSATGTTAVGTNVTATCNNEAGYYTVSTGAPTASCSSATGWTISNKCGNASCSNTSTSLTANNASFTTSGSTTASGTTISGTCNSNYILTGSTNSNSDGSLTAKCQNGTWVLSTSCVAGCPASTDGNNAYHVKYPNLIVGQTYLAAECADGYELADGGKDEDSGELLSGFASTPVQQIYYKYTQEIPNNINKPQVTCTSTGITVPSNTYYLPYVWDKTTQYSPQHGEKAMYKTNTCYLKCSSSYKPNSGNDDNVTLSYTLNTPRAGTFQAHKDVSSNHVVFCGNDGQWYNPPCKYNKSGIVKLHSTTCTGWSGAGTPSGCSQ